MSDREVLHGLIDELPEPELNAARRYLEFLSHSALDEESIDAETGAKLDAALAERGDAVPLAEVKRRYGL